MNKPTVVTLEQVFGPNYDLHWLQKWAAIRGPSFIWRAIKICVRDKKQFPDWVIDYLDQCADRMSSDKAKRADELTEILPWIFKFPARKKSGPGGLLKQDFELTKDLGEWLFAVIFASELRESGDPADAKDIACNFVFGDDSELENTQLNRILKRVFRLEKLPQTAEAWLPVFNRHLKPLGQHLDAIAAERFDFTDK
jgi:hypothetical protein